MAKYKVYVKDTRTFQFTLKEGGAYADLTNKTPWLTCKENHSSTSSIFSNSGTVTVASEGTCQIALSSSDTATAYENTVCQVTVVDGDDNRVVYGEFRLDIHPSCKS